MSTITYSRQFAPDRSETEAAPRRPFWRRVYEAAIAARQRQAEREVAAYVNQHGGLLTDEMEREVMRRLSGVQRKPF